MTKRFYKNAAVLGVDGVFAVTLDDRPIKTPAGNPMHMPTRALAEAVAGEWNAQGDEVDPKSMPLMQLCGTAIDRVPDVRDGLIEGILRYADTDLLCHRAASPADLAARQEEVWQPLLDWAKDAYGANLKSVEGVIPIAQDPHAGDGFAAAMADMDNWQLTAVAEMVGISGSIVIGFALYAGRLDAETAFNACQVDEDHQIALWGEDFEATQRRANVRAELLNAARFLELLGD
ncbi:ATP12 family chaperone protein [Magnetovibrio sp.]|uniref:ATP12 family chaperone protein n=1 Tax=Magnetovibrio sp. TaxID=2024836 RepID=UPI002F95C68A